MKKITILLSLVLVFAMAILSGCGSSTSSTEKNFVGTWKSEDGLVHYFIQIEKQSDTTYSFKRYLISKDDNTSYLNRKTLEVKKDDPNVLASSPKNLYIFKDGNLIDSSNKTTYTKVSDKILPYEEFNTNPNSKEPK